MQSPSVPARLRRSRHLSWFTHLGAVYLFHDLYGYLMEMSPDVADMIQSFDDGVDTPETVEFYRGKLGDADPQQFVDVLASHAVLVNPDEDEIEAVWAFVPIKGKWNVWQRRDDRLTLWTAWGDRPVQQIFLDPEETRIWDALSGEKRLIEMRHHYDNDKLLGLVRRLVHSDVQALKLSMMPWSVYAKRPSLAPAYLSSTMPYQRWQPGTPVPPAVPLTAYHVHDITDPADQFDHKETTLSHLLRVPHPALGGRTYGHALVDALAKRGAIEDGMVRVLEIGGGLGYIAQHVIERLRGTGRTVEYTIVELSPALARAQRDRLQGDATWIEGDVLAAALPEHAFDLVICNEMAGDMPALQLSRPDIGLDASGTGTADRDKVRAVHPLAEALELDDAPEPFYLQTGAFELVAKIAKALAPGGTAVITEFGEMNAWPKLSTQLDHPELSTHFGHLEQIARAESLETSVEFVIDLIELDRAQHGLATTRSHFRALRALAASADLELPKIGYTRELLAHTVAGKLDLDAIGELRFDRIEDRLMGLVPHEFKALLAKKPS
jgi:SAM-dependent methyltransferase